MHKPSTSDSFPVNHIPFDAFFLKLYRIFLTDILNQVITIGNHIVPFRPDILNQRFQILVIIQILYCPIVRFRIMSQIPLIIILSKYIRESPRQFPPPQFTR